MGPTVKNKFIQDSISCHILNIEKFFEIESIPQKINKLNNEVKHYFEETNKRTETSQYIFRLPFIENFQLEYSSNHALKAFYALERKLTSDPDLHQTYSNFTKNMKTLITD